MVPVGSTLFQVNSGPKRERPWQRPKEAEPPVISDHVRLLTVIDYAGRALRTRPWRKKTVIVQPYAHDSPFCGLPHYHISWFPYSHNNMWWASPKIGTSTLWESPCCDAVMNLNHWLREQCNVILRPCSLQKQSCPWTYVRQGDFEVNRSCYLVTKLYFKHNIITAP